MKPCWAVVGLLTIVVAGCASSPSTTASAGSTPATSASAASTVAARTGIKAGTAPRSPASGTPTASAGPPGFLSFELPSHNIGCYVESAGNAGPSDGGSARCDITQADWTPPDRPSTCSADWGHALELTPGDARFACVSDSAQNDAVVQYGTVQARGSFSCDVEETGVTCTDVDTGHGFSLSRERYRVF